MSRFQGNARAFPAARSTAGEEKGREGGGGEKRGGRRRRVLGVGGIKPIGWEAAADAEEVVLG